VSSDELGIRDSLVNDWVVKLKESKILQCPVNFEFTTLRGVFSCSGFHVSGNRFCFLSNNITELKRLTAELEAHKSDLQKEVKARTLELEEALQVKGRFLAVMSHEMRTPLTGLTTALSLLSESSLTSDQQELTKISGVCGDQLLVVINDVLDLSKMEENRMTLEKLPIDILRVLEESLDIVALEAEKKKIELIFEVEENVPQVYVIFDPICTHMISD